MRKKIKKVWHCQKGEGYIDVAVGVLCLMLVVELCMVILPFLNWKEKSIYYKRIFSKRNVSVYRTLEAKRQ